MQIYANESRDLLLKILIQQNLSMYINSEKRCLNRKKQMYANLCKFMQMSYVTYFLKI